jgi:uncharacterized membrane protein YraQ (UPF0718 family)
VTLSLQHLREFATFVVLDGLLLFSLFYVVTILIALAQQHSGLQDLTRSMKGARLVRGSIYAAAVGAITPFCSCSTIPIFAGMLRARIRFGISMTFLMSSPLVDEAVVIVMARYFGLVRTIAFVILSSLFAILAGIAFDLLGFERSVIDRPEEDVPGEVVKSDSATIAIPWRAKIRYAAVLARTELRSVVGYVFLGLLLGGAIHGFIPQSWIMTVNARVGLALMVPLMALLGTPVYLNMAAAIPVAFALTEKGVPLGAVIAFLVTGGGVSVPEIVLLLKMVRPPLVVAFVVAMIMIAVAMGYIFTYFL